MGTSAIAKGEIARRLFAMRAATYPMIGPPRAALILSFSFHQKPL